MFSHAPQATCFATPNTVSALQARSAEFPPIAKIIAVEIIQFSNQLLYSASIQFHSEPLCNLHLLLLLMIMLCHQAAIVVSDVL